MCFTELIEEVLGAEHGLSVHAALIEVDRRMARNPNGEVSSLTETQDERRGTDDPSSVSPECLTPSDTCSDVERVSLQALPGCDTQSSGASGQDGEHLNECVCCFERPADVVFTKCGHLAYCKSCRNKALKRAMGPEWNAITSFARRLRRPLRCPLCRTESQAVDRVRFTGAVFTC